MSQKRKRRAFIRIPIKALKWLVVGVVALVLLTYGFLQTGPGRGLVRRVAIEQVNKVIAGNLTVDSVVTLTIATVRLDGVALDAPGGQRVADIESVVVQYDVWAMLRGEIEIVGVTVNRPRVRLENDDEGNLTLLAAVAPASPPAPEEEEVVEEEPSGEGTRVRVADLLVAGGELAVLLPDVPPGLGFRDLAIRGRVRIFDQIGVDIDHVAMTLTGPDGPLLRMQPLTAQLRTGPEAVTQASLRLLGKQDRIRADVSIRGIGGTEPLALDARLRFDRLTNGLLGDLGMTDLQAQTPSWIAGEITARGTFDDLRFAADLETPGGPLTFSGGFRSPLDADLAVETPGLELSELSSALPEMAVGIDLRVAMRPVPDAGPEDEQRRFEVRLLRANIDNEPLPSVSLDAVLAADAVVLETMTLPVFGDRFELSGRFQFPVAGSEGSPDEPAVIDAEIAIDGIDLDELPQLDAFARGADGTVDMDYDVYVVLQDDPRVRTDGTLTVRRFELGDIAAELVDVTGSVTGRVSAPRVDLDVRARSAGTPDITIESAELTVAGGPTDYTLAGRVALADGPRTSLDIAASWRNERINASGSLLVTQEGETLEANFTNVAYALSGLVEAERLRLRHPQIDVRVSGRYDLDGEADARVEITRLDLGVFDGRLFLPDLPLDGRVQGQIAVSGTPDDPRGRVDLRWQDGVAGPVEAIAAYLVLDYQPTGLTTRGRVEVGDQLSVAIDGTAAFESRAPPAEAVANALFDMQIEIDADDLSLLGTLAPDAPLQSGALDASVTFRGRIDDPTVVAELRGMELAVEGAPTIDFWTMTSLREERLTTALDVWDDNGRLITLRGSTGLGWEDLTEGELMARIDEARIELEAEIPSRPIDSFGVAAGPLEELPFDVALQASITREPSMLPMGELHLQVEGRGLEAYDRVGAEPCENYQPFSLTLDAQLEEGQSGVEANVRLGEHTPINWRVASTTPFSQWIETGVEELPAVASRLIINELDLSQLPLVCHAASGIVDGEIIARELLTDTPVAELDLHADALVLGDAATVVASVSGRLDRSELDVDVRLDDSHGSVATVTARAPVTWGGEQYAPALRDEPLSAELVLDQFRVAPLASVVPIFRGEGFIDGSVRVEGPLDGLEPNGQLELSGVVISIPGLDQRLSNVRGRIAITPEEIQLDNLRASDRDGTIRINGRVAMADLQPQDGTLRIRADDFPTRQSGLIVARLNADARARARFEEERTLVTVTFDDLGVRLPEQSAGSVMSLEPNPDIVFVDEFAIADEEGVAEGEAELVPAAKPIVIEVDATNPFWVRRSDFSLQLSADLRIVSDADGTRISGPVEFRRGFFDLMTKTFDLEEGDITFTGARELDPILNIVATHELARYPGDTVTVRISGRLSEPTLEFETTMPGIETNAEILALLVTGRAGESGSGTESDSAENQVASFLSGLTAGLLTLTARNELGDAVPIISVQTGEDLRDVQVRAGFVADSLIPRFLRNFVTGMYVEGFVGTSEEGEGAETEQVTTGGFLIELYFPNGWLTSGTFQPPINWSLDVLWRP